MARRRGSNRVFELGIILLLNEILNVGLNVIPPVTLFTIALQTLLYIDVLDVSWTRNDACISAYKVLVQKDWRPLVLSVVEHADDMHLYYNMVSFLIKGRTLEAKYGSRNFAALLAILSLMCSSMYVATTTCMANLLQVPELMTSCAIGFSGVIFALKVVTTMEDPTGYSHIYGMQVPTRYAAWVELILISILVPNSSFAGHFAGVLVGLLYMKTYIGTLIDHLIQTVTGEPMCHTGSRQGSRGSFRSHFRDETNEARDEGIFDSFRGSFNEGSRNYGADSFFRPGSSHTYAPPSYGWRYEEYQ